MLAGAGTVPASVRTPVELIGPQGNRTATLLGVGWMTLNSGLLVEGPGWRRRDMDGRPLGVNGRRLAVDRIKPTHRLWKL
jgi:hypothetical protein